MSPQKSPKVPALTLEKEREAFFGALSADIALPNSGKSARTYLDKPILKRGSKGADVREAQMLLVVTPDGDFGKATERRVREFQAANGLPATGVVDPQTWAKLLKEEFVGTREDRQARTTQTLSTVQSFLTQGTDFLQQLTQPAQTTLPQVQTADIVVPEQGQGKLGWPHYAAIAGGILLLGTAGYFTYRHFTKE